jgi:hypothetical protein
MRETILVLMLSLAAAGQSAVRPCESLASVAFPNTTIERPDVSGTAK